MAVAVVAHASVLVTLAPAKRVTRTPEHAEAWALVEVPIEAAEPAVSPEPSAAARLTSEPSPATSSPAPTTTSKAAPAPLPVPFGSDPLDAIHAQIATWDRRLLKGEHRIDPNARLQDVDDFPDRRTPRTLIDRVVATNYGRFRACHYAGVPRSALVAGVVRVAFVIEPDGKVTQIRDAGGGIDDEAVRRCVVQAFGRLAFAPTALRRPQSLTYDVTLTPEGEEP